MFFAFAGYARIATLGEEVKHPTRTIPRAILVALAIALAVYIVVAVAALAVLGPTRLAASAAPLVEAVRVAGVGWLTPIVGVGAAVAALGSLLALILGVSRTTLAMARDRHLPHPLAVVHPRVRGPASGRARRRCRRGSAGSNHRYPWRNWFLVLCCVGLLRNRQRLCLHPER